MKKITLLLCMCLAALAVPQGVWAETVVNASAPKITVDGSVLTIESSAIEELMKYMQNASSDNKSTMVACSKIVLKGFFNGLDLQSIQGDNPAGFVNVTEVDMTDAQFVKPASSSNVYQLFEGAASGSPTGNYLTNATLYLWQKTRRWNGPLQTWDESNYPTEGTSMTTYGTVELMNADKDNPDKSIGDYAKVLDGYRWLQMSISNESWSSNGVTAQTPFFSVNWLEDSLYCKKYLYSNGQSVRLRKYYRKQLWERFTGAEPVVGSNVEGYTFQETLDPSKTYIYNGNNFSSSPGSPLNAYINQLANTGNSCKEGDYIWFYVYYKRENGAWVRIKENDNASAEPSCDRYIEDKLYTDAEIKDIAPTNESEVIRLKWYFKRRADDSYIWEECYPTSSDLSGKVIYDGAGVGATYGALDGNIGASGAYLYFNVYYTKNDLRSWTNETGTDPGSSVDATFDYAYRDNHTAGYKNGEWVKMPNYNYYRLDNEGSYAWTDVEFTDGSTYPISQIRGRYEDLTGGSEGQYAVVVNNTSEDEHKATGNVPDYGEMSFKYWKNTLTTATTSKYANTSISNDIFQDCKSLTSVNYLAGNVRGFLDHKADQNYTDGLSVTIGKDVTQIDNDAFKRCDVLRSLTFDTDYKDYVWGPDDVGHVSGDPKSGSEYPKPLTIGDYAFQDCKNLMNVFIPNRVISIGNSAFEHAGNKTQAEASQASTGIFVVTFERRRRDLDGSVSINYDHDLTIGNGCFNQCYNLETLSLPIRLSSLGSGAFTDTPNLQSLTIREEPTEDSRLKVIPSNAFLRSGIKSVTIPRSVLEIESGAFTECFNIETITFQETNDKVGDVQKPLIIRETAFAGGTESKYKLKKVIVNIHPATRLLVCEYNAFNFTSLVGQTDVESSQEAVLEFDDADWDYYQGNWKKGYAFSQSNLNLFKDGSTRGSAQATVGNNGLALTNEAKEPRNGWQQFAMSTLGVEVVIPQGNYLRTYSTKTPHYIPIIAGTTNTYLYDIYRISAFSDGWNSGDDVNDREKADQATRTATATQVTNEIGSRRYVPASTGLIMQIHGNSDDKYIVYQEEFSSSVEGYVYYPHETSTGNINFLWPSCDDVTITVDNEKKVVINPTDPYPLSGSGERYRIFGLWVEDNAFWRSEPGVLINPDMAYLKLPVGVFRWANEGAGTTPNYTGAGARIALHFSDDESEVSGIGSVVNTFDSNDSYYTIQGVKVSQPQKKGLYIINGKKIFVK